MFFRKLVFFSGLFIAAFFFSPGRAMAQETSPVKVELYLPYDAVETGVPFYIVYKISNVSGEDYLYNDFSCSSFDLWRTESEGLDILGWQCRSNYPLPTTLKSGESKKGVTAVVYYGEAGETEVTLDFNSVVFGDKKPEKFTSGPLKLKVINRKQDYDVDVQRDPVRGISWFSGQVPEPYDISKEALKRISV